MTQLALDSFADRTAPRTAVAFAAASLGVIAVSAALAGLAPLGFSIIIVFLFAGPHNWMEVRYFLGRMPAHWGPMRAFFTTAVCGVLVLSAAYIAMPIVGRAYEWTPQTWTLAGAAWNSTLTLWVAGLVVLRRREKARLHGGEAQIHLPLAIAFAMIWGIWTYPAAWDVAIVYLHPLLALWFLDREIARRRPEWLPIYRRCLLAVPVALVVLWWRLANAPPLAGNDMRTMRITQHAGADILAGISSHALVATHTFLEMLHYGAWIVAIPLVGMKAAPWNLAGVPLARRAGGWKHGVIAVAALGSLAVLLLWGAFLADYPLTRDIYFTVAIAHVLAEAPFLLRML